MQNIKDWKPTKIINTGKRFKPNPASISIHSYYVCNTYLKFYIDYIKRYASGKLLDCGCGTVPYYEIYRELVDEIYCTDWENSMHDNKFVDAYSDLNTRLNFESEFFDTVLLTDVLEHIYNPSNLMNEIARVLKPGGKVIIAVPFFYWIHEQPHDYYRYTEFTLRRICEDSGLKILELEPYGGYLDVLFDTINKVFIRKKFLLKVFMPLALMIKKSFINRKINKKHQNKYPLGYILCAEKL